MRNIITLTCVIVASASASAAEAEFKEGPTAKRAVGEVVIEFELAGPADVEVAILGEDGTVVRHMAAGMLGGENPPPKPLRPGLSQSLTWDGKDDLGKPADGGPFTVRVRAGLTPELDGFIGESKCWIGQLCGLATDPEGNLYVYSSSVRVHRGSSRHLQVFDREGTYIRTIMPMPANLPRRKLRPFKTTSRRGKTLVTPKDPGEHFYPRNYFGTWPEFYPDPVGELVPVVSADGTVTLADGRAFTLARITNRGEATGDRFWRSVWKRKLMYWRRVAGERCVVPAPDGKHLYLSGFYRSEKKKGPVKDENWPWGRIYRMKNTPDGHFENWADLTGGDKTPVAGCAVFDPEGRLLVADPANHRVAILDQTGKQVGSFKAEATLAKKHTVGPGWIGCHRNTGAVYALFSKKTGYHRVARRLVKYSRPEDGASVLGRHDLGNTDYSIEITLGDGGDPPVIWTGFRRRGKGMELLRIEDRDGEFVVTKDLMDLNQDRFGVKPRMAVHPETDLVVCNNGAATLNGYNGLTGEEVDLPFQHGADMAVGLDGNWYVQTGPKYSGPICRYTDDLKPLVVPNRDKPPRNKLGAVYGRMGAGFCTVGMAADPTGRVYSMQMYDWARYCVGIFGPDGRPEDPGRMKNNEKMKKCPRFDSAIVGPIGSTPGGIQLDWEGNIYIGLSVRPQGHTPPAGFEKDPAYRTCVGSVVRFRPDGGAVVKTKKKPKGEQGRMAYQHKRHHGPRFLENATRLYPGLGCMSGKFGDFCMCRQPMFQVDRWGRILIPNAITCSVRVVDNAGNEITRFGHYGNIDSRGPGEDSLIKTPAVPLGWPEAVGASKTAIYVADVLNRRIVRMRKTWAAEEVVEVK